MCEAIGMNGYIANACSRDMFHKAMASGVSGRLRERPLGQDIMTKGKSPMMARSYENFG